MRDVGLAKALGGAQLSDVVGREEPDSSGTSEDRVYVLEVSIFGDEYCGTSVHTTVEGARARLKQKVDEYEVGGAYEAEAHYATRSDNVIASEQDGDMVTWRISRLPIETP